MKRAKLGQDVRKASSEVEAVMTYLAWVPSRLDSSFSDSTDSTKLQRRIHGGCQELERQEGSI